ncbi:MAG TPA: hypothetical protein VHC49_25630 [Mycobacteriales bacterium]|nr:hypothetical protein [Mycobacteriales bacterium]
MSRHEEPAFERESLPLIDEHAQLIAAPADQVWAGLGRMLAGAVRSPGARGAVRLLGVRPARAAGDPLVAGSAIPGFGVASATPAAELVLLGEHPFSRYALTFRLQPEGDATRVRAESRGLFPGLTGRIYHTLVVGSGGHVFSVRRMLRAIATETQQLSAS